VILLLSLLLLFNLILIKTFIKKYIYRNLESNDLSGVIPSFIENLYNLEEL